MLLHVNFAGAVKDFTLGVSYVFISWFTEESKLRCVHIQAVGNLISAQQILPNMQGYMKNRMELLKVQL